MYSIHVYDNINTYMKRYEKEIDNYFAHTEISQIFIKPPKNSFWFYTPNLVLDKKSIDLFRSYVHFHKNSISPQDIHNQFGDKPPIPIHPSEIKYDPKSECLVIRDSIIPWKKPLWKSEKTHYIGDIDINRKTPISYNIFLDFGRKRINVILGVISTTRS